MNTVVIGVHVYAEPERLHATLAALCEHATHETEIVLLPDGPDPAVRSALEQVRQYAQLGTSEPLGTAACFNRLAGVSSAEVILLLESGALVGPGWLEIMLNALTAHPRNGLAGPSTNLAWNMQEAFRGTTDTALEIAQTAHEAFHRFGTQTRTLEPLYSLADFCYAVRREVIRDIGLADEGYGLGPCWEMDFNIRAARAGWQGVWVCGAYVHRAPMTERRRRDEARLFEASKRRYQDKFCGARLRGEKKDYRSHCRGDACPNFAPRGLIHIAQQLPSREEAPAASNARSPALVTAPLVSCIMPTCDRLRFAAEAVRCFQRQDYPQLELIVVDDGKQPVAAVLPDDPRLRLIRLSEKRNVGAKRNAACAAARGEFIVHWDDDDWYPCDRVSRQMAVLQTAGAEICGTSTLFYYDLTSGRSWRYRYCGGTRPWVAGSTLAYRKRWWSAHPFPEIQVGEDTRFVWAAPEGVVRDMAAPELCLARIHNGNTSRKHTNGSSWEPRPTDGLQALLGLDWPHFAGARVERERGTVGPLVSCIMPTFNRRPFLPLALEAFLAQDYPSKELVIVDDGDEPVTDLVAGANSVRHIFLKQRTSIGCKRNVACEAARGSIIAHWDDDDWYGAARLSHQIAPLVAGQADVTGLENALQLELGTGEFWRTTPDLHRRMFVGDLHGGTLVFWKSLFNEGLRYPEINLAEDAMLLRQAQRQGKRLLRLSNPGLFVYMRHRHNSWRFQTGEFLDPKGWQRVARPESFSAELLGAFCRAAVALAGQG